MRRIGLLAFPILLWWVGSFYFLGDLGKWIDDYAAHVRDPVTGTFSWIEMLRPQWWFFWRPIHVQLVFTLQTLFWNHDWANHLFSALMHALACLSLWHFLRECGVRPLVAACAGIIMLASPQAFEAIFWPATVSTSIACAAYFFACRIVVRFAQRRNRRGAIAALGVLGLAIPSLYEQPAAALAALPILYAAAAWPTMRAGSFSAGVLLTETRRCILLLTPCALGVIVYLAAFAITVRRDAMARESQFVGHEAMVGRTGYMFRTLGDLLNPFQGLEELLGQGLRVFGDSTLGLFGLSAAIAICALGWIGVWQTGTRPSTVQAVSQVPGLQASNRVLLLAFAAAAIALSLLPIIAIRGAGLSPRLMYFPLACVIMAGAVLANGVIVLLHKKLGLRALMLTGAALQALVIIYAAFGVTALVGAQAFSRSRSEKDRLQLAELRALMPDPAPGTLFVPLRVTIDPRDPSAPRLRTSYGPIWSSPWGVNTAIKHLYRRDDVHATCIYLHNQATAIARMGDPAMIAWSHYCWNLPTPRMENMLPKFPLAQIVPFAIDGDGRVRLVERLTVGEIDASAIGSGSGGGDGGSAEREFVFAQAAAARSRGVEPISMRLALPLQPRGEDGVWLAGWRWPYQADPETKFLRIASWGASERAVRMHPVVPGYTLADGDTHEMVLDLPPSKLPRRLVFYATFAEDNIDISTRGDGVELLWSLDDDAPLRTLSVDPARSKSERRWERAEIVVPPTDRVRTLRVQCLPGPKGNTSCDRVVVSCGIEMGAADTEPLGPPKSRSPLR